MKNLMKASVLLASGTVLAASLLTACAPMDAFKPEKPKAVEQQNKLELPDNLSEALAELLITALESDPVAVFGNAGGSDAVNFQGFVNLFDLTGQGVIRGISTQKFYRGNTRTDGNGADKFEVQVQVFARGAGLNRELTFGGELMNATDERTKGFVALERTSPDEALNAYIDCLDIDPPLKQAMKSDNAFDIKVMAACFDLTCDTVVLKMELLNQGDVMVNSRVGLAFEDRSTPGQKNLDQEVVMTLADASLKDLLSFAEAQSGREAEEIAPQCQHIVNQDGVVEPPTEQPAALDPGDEVIEDSRPAPRTEEDGALAADDTDALVREVRESLDADEAVVAEDVVEETAAEEGLVTDPASEDDEGEELDEEDDDEVVDESIFVPFTTD